MNKVYFFILLLLSSNCVHSQGVVVGTANTNPDPSAILDINSTTKGFLPPRLTLAQRNAIQKPAIGLMIWCTDCNEMQVYNGFMWTNTSGTAAVVKTPAGMQICYNTWMYKNLTVRTYRNGDSIPVVTDPTAWANLTTGAMCWYNNDSATYNNTYGVLYNWYAVNDPRGLAPAGWHIPKNTEWNILSNCLGGDAAAGGKMKDVLALWAAPNSGATNTSGFSGLPGGLRNSDGSFGNVSVYANWWGNEESNPGNSVYRYLYYQNANLSNAVISKNAGLSIRCVKD